MWVGVRCCTFGCTADSGYVGDVGDVRDVRDVSDVGEVGDAGYVADVRECGLMVYTSLQIFCKNRETEELILKSRLCRSYSQSSCLLD